MSLKAAVIGTGSMGMNHLRTLKAMGDPIVRIVGIAEPFQQNRIRAEEQYHVKGYEDYNELFDLERPDFVIVAVPTISHFTVASAAIRQKIHVLIEKPIAGTIEEAQQLISLAKEYGVLLTVGHVERFNPAVRELKQQLNDNRLGDIYSIQARRLGPFPTRIGDVGVTLDLAPHDLDIIRFVTNSQILRLYAEYFQRIHQNHEDGLHVTMRLENDIHATLDINWLTPTKVRELSVLGERGLFIVNYLTQELYFYENDSSPLDWESLKSIKGVSEGTMTRFKVQRAEPLKLELEHFIQSILNNSQPEVSGEDGMWVLKIIESIFKSAKTHSSQEIIPLSL